MKLPIDSIIAPEKLYNYLLVWRARNDKSHWLARAGYAREHWHILEDDLRSQLLSLEATFIEKNEYGKTYEIRGVLTGPNGHKLSVCSIWMTETATGQTKFITL
jgi:hypothetical protein